MSNPGGGGQPPSNHGQPPTAPLKTEVKTEAEDGALPNDILRLLNDNDNPAAPSGPPAKNDPVSCGVCQKDVSSFCVVMLNAIFSFRSIRTPTSRSLSAVTVAKNGTSEPV